MTLLEVLLGASTILLAATTLGMVYMIKRELETEESVEVDPDKVRGAVSESWQKLELGEKIGSLENQVEEVGKEAEKIEELHRDIENMLENPQERGDFGEKKLEDLLSRHLPSNMFSLQGTVAGKRPDAYIESSTGKVCIDSKFPLSNFREMREAEDEEERSKKATKFRSDVKKQLEEVRKKYVRPDSGTTEYAFEFVPSERVYYYLVKEEYDLLIEYAQQGVQLVSPLTLGQKLELIRNDVHTAQLSRRAEEIQQKLQEISGSFSEFEDTWKTYRKHIKRAKDRSDDLEKSFENLKRDFDSVSRLEKDNVSGKDL